jgi:hypothetical protein
MKRKANQKTTINTTQSSCNKADFGYDLNLLYEYLVIRSKMENVGWELEMIFFVNEFEKGCRNFFGVEVNQIGFPLWDDQEFKKGELNNYICWYFLVAKNQLKTI